jgi:hypothetical protein
MASDIFDALIFIDPFAAALEGGIFMAPRN